jgi:hypothetical protein
MVAKLKVVENFFDRPKVIAAIDEASRESLAKAGGAIRVTARNSMKPTPIRRRADREQKAKAAGRQLRPQTARAKARMLASAHAPPGSPPRYNIGLLRDLLFFSWDPGTRSLVIGPVGFSRSKVPEVLEQGGSIMVSVATRKVQGQPLKRVRKQVQIAARPYMSPALAKNIQKIPEFWKNSVSKG